MDIFYKVIKWPFFIIIGSFIYIIIFKKISDCTWKESIKATLFGLIILFFLFYINNYFVNNY